MSRIKKSKVLYEMESQERLRRPSLVSGDGEAIFRPEVVMFFRRRDGECERKETLAKYMWLHLEIAAVLKEKEFVGAAFLPQTFGGETNAAAAEAA